jgi:signal transduction histidine kinase
LIALSAPLLAMRDILPDGASIIAGNTLVSMGYTGMMIGGGLLLEQKPHRGVAILLPVTTLLFWTVAWLMDPGNIHLRIVASGVLALVLAGFLTCYFYRARWLPDQIRWAGCGLNLIHGVSTIFRVVDSATEQGAAVYLDGTWIQGLWHLEAIFYAWSQFVLMLMVVGAQLSRALRENNQRLTAEVQTRQRLQEELSAALTQESAMRREQRLFVDMVSHEFRTPLAVIDRAAEMIVWSESAGVGSQEQISQRTRNIRDAVRRLRLMIDTFLSDERLESGRMNPVKTNLVALLRQVCQQVAPENERRIVIAKPREPDVFVSGDISMLSIIISNVLDNALKYSPPQETVCTRIVAADGMARLMVIDRGKGIPEKEQALVGQRFFRASNTTAESGTGLGLFTAARLVAFHKGTISVHSRPGETRVTITLPLVEQSN